MLFYNSLFILLFNINYELLIREESYQMQGLKADVYDYELLGKMNVQIHG